MTAARNCSKPTTETVIIRQRFLNPRTKVCMESKLHNQDKLELFVAPGTLPLFATVLQAGIVLQTRRGDKLGVFLDKLPGFTHEYIINAIQTIFLNGTAIDDLETPLTGDSPVLALSAAMPGLAGAIFRKNSFHAALRTTHKEEQVAHRDDAIASVHLKLFNSIARDRGPALLTGGVSIKTSSLLSFFQTSPSMLSHLHSFRLDGRENGQEITGCLEQERYINLTVREFS